MNDLKVFQWNPFKPFWPPLTIRREFDAYVLSLGLIRYDLPDPASKPACRAVIECIQASSSKYHGNLFSYRRHQQLLNSIVLRIGNRNGRRKAKKGVRSPRTFGIRRLVSNVVERPCPSVGVVCECQGPQQIPDAGVGEATVAATADGTRKAKAVGKKTVSKSVGATGGKGQRKGPQPAKYRDPRSGATWSGRGPAPAWLAGAKDRASFLIDGAGAAAGKKPVVTKAVAKNVSAAKKTAAKKAVSAKVRAKKAPAKSAAEERGRARSGGRSRLW